MLHKKHIYVTQHFDAVQSLYEPNLSLGASFNYSLIISYSVPKFLLFLDNTAMNSFPQKTLAIY